MSCDKCDNPFFWENDVIETSEEVTITCSGCSKKSSFKNYGRCAKCGFWLDEKGYCDMCNEEDEEQGERCDTCGHKECFDCPVSGVDSDPFEME